MSKTQDTGLFGECLDKDERRRQRFRERYRTDPAFREKCKAANRARYQNDPKIREERNKAAREYYAQFGESPAMAAKKIAAARERYHADPEYRRKRLAQKRKNYREQTAEQRAKKRARVKKLYAERPKSRAAMLATYTKWVSKNRLRAHALRAIARATKKGLPYDKDFLLLLAERNPQNCECCGREFDYSFIPTGKRVIKPSTPSFDRIDPPKGYVPGNVAVLCCRCNILKRDGTLAEFEAIVNFMRKRLGRMDS